jgi:alpha-L-fucosidase 2
MVMVACAIALAWALPRAAAAPPSKATERVLWYRHPAQNWEKEALPIGNGRLGGMVFGGVAEEHIQFNEDSLWIGDESDTGAYQAFGSVFIELGEGPFQDYRRQLDLGDGVHEITYTRDGTRYRREYFSSYPAQVMVMRLTADKPSSYTGRIRLTDAHEAEIAVDGNRITSSGSLAGYVYAGGSTRGRKEPYDLALDYEAQLLVLHEGGELAAADDGITFTGCNALTLLLAADTDYVNRRDRGWKGEHPHKRIAGQIEAAAATPYDELREAHVVDYRALFDRCAIDLGQTPPEIGALPTDERLDKYDEGATDPDLEELLFQYARYMMIASSRPGSLPANLQGLWNRSNRPPWRSDYHTDVNVQMNYWFVDAANLPECFRPLAEWVYSIREVRREETKAEFGTRGWATHAENGIFGGSTWKWSKGDAAWVAQNLWDHYAFTQDKQYLRRRAYPILKDLCQFWVDHLKELPDGTLVSPNGFSPEHGPHEDGVSFDQQLAWDLFTNYLQAAEALEVDAEFREKIAAMRKRLLGPQIGRWGQLQEWMVDRDDPNDQHRHLSHMIAVHPGRQISPLTTPELAEAARVSMNARGDASTGWSRAWKISIWARLHDGNRAYRILNGMLKQMIHDNLFNTHPPFQIDGNFGYAAGVCEMLLQSHTGEIHLLPALPDAWATGRFCGMRARGGVEIDLHWEEGRATKAVLRATADGTHTIRPPKGQQVDGPNPIELKAGQCREIRFE